MSTRVGIRELQQHASQVLDRVVAGERVEVTRSGRLIAVISPPEFADQEYDDLVASGILIPGEGNLLDWSPLPARPDQRPLSEILIDMREEDER